MLVRVLELLQLLREYEYTSASILVAVYGAVYPAARAHITFCRAGPAFRRPRQIPFPQVRATLALADRTDEGQIASANQMWLTKARPGLRLCAKWNLITSRNLEAAV